MSKQSFGAFLPGYEYIPDPEPYVFGDRVYIFGSHDKFGGKKFCLNDYVCYSAPIDDLADWRYEGVIYRKEQDPENADGKMQLYAPDVAQGSDGRYYLYYCLSKEGCGISVAVCDSPAGKYEFLGFVKDEQGNVIGKRAGDTIPFDPAVLVDDDGRVWLYSGNGPRALGHDKKRHKAQVCMELESDMITLKAEPVPILPTLHNEAGTGYEGHAFFEASSIRKFGSKYYLIYSSVQFHELCYAISDKPDRDFVYAGVLISNGDIRPESDVKISFNGKANMLIKNYIGNNHGSIIEIDGKYYVVYHRHTNRNMFSRQVCAAEIKINPDGTFEQAEMTSQGFNGKPLDGKGKYEARIACQLYSKHGALFSVHPFVQNKKHPALTQDGKDREDNSNQHISNMCDGATAVYKYFDFDNVSSVTVSVRGEGGGNLLVRTKREADAVANIAIKPSKDWTQFNAKLQIPSGVHALYFTYEGKYAVDFLDFAIV